MGTAAVETNSLIGTYDPNIVDGGAATIIKAAIGDDPEAQRRLADTWTFQVRAETSSDNDPVTVVNLNTQGVSWVGDNNIRNITTKAWFRNVAGTIFGYSENVMPVKGSAAGTTPTIATTVNGIPAGVQTNHSYRVRTGLLSTTQTTPVYVTAAAVISSSAVVVRCQGGLSGQDLRWLVEVDVGPLRIVPIAVT